MADERAWLPTHLQQAEKTLDKPAKKATSTRETVARPARVLRRKAVPVAQQVEKKFRTVTSRDEKWIRELEEGATYKLTVHNSLTNTVRKVVGRFDKIDDMGTLWFRESGTGARRYFRASAVMKHKKVK